MNELGDLGVVGATGKSAYISIYIVSWEELHTRELERNSTWEPSEVVLEIDSQ